MSSSRTAPRGRVVQVVFVSATVGAGTPEDPLREVDMYFSLDGEELACFDPFYGGKPFVRQPHPVPLGTEWPYLGDPLLTDPAAWVDDPVPDPFDGYRAECKRLFGHYEPYGEKRRRQALSITARDGGKK